MMKKKSPSWLTTAQHWLTNLFLLNLILFNLLFTTKFQLLLTTKSLQPSLILSKLMEKRM